MKKILFSFILLTIIVLQVNAQAGKITGTVKDASLGETLIGATVQLKGTTSGTVTDIDGNFVLDAPFGSAVLVISYIGFTTTEVSVNVSRNTPRVIVSLKSVILDEVVIVADIAKARETPIAYSNILPAKLEEELAGRDIPMVLNTTPGVYATQQGGGDGDARITIRGFNQRNIAIMLDGVPVNDMENGWVYWSNWFGLDVIQRQMQVQRGLGASRLGIPSVGGTINILTQGIDNKPMGTIKQEITDFGYYRTSFGASSGRIGDWGFTVAGSYKWGSGWFDASETKGFFYYLKAERRIGNHIISFTGYGAPQEHAQRSYKFSAGMIDSTYAADVAGMEFTLADTAYFTLRTPSGEGRYSSFNLGRKYNQHWGYLRRWTIDDNGYYVGANEEKLNEKMNYYHKPQFNIKDTWRVNDKIFISNLAYLSLGNGGGTGLKGSNPRQTPDGQIDFQFIYDNHRKFIGDGGLYQGTNHLYSSINNHKWLGYLGHVEYEPNDSWNLSGGLDLRTYRGEHYRELYDLIGGDMYIEPILTGQYNNQDNSRLKKVGDKIYYNNDGLVRWYGTFMQAEYKNPIWSGFLSGSLSNTRYKRIDYFAPYMIGDEVIEFRQSAQDPFTWISQRVMYEGQAFYIGHPDVTQPNKESPWKSFLGYTLKAGFNYNLSERVNIFINAGNLSKAPRFRNVFAGNTNNVPKNLKNEVVYAVELGSGYASSKFSANLNTYYTSWVNKPLDFTPSTQNPNNTEERIYLNITGVSARHMGVELDFIYKPIRSIEIQGILSLGDWIYNTADSVGYVDDAGLPVPNASAINYDAKGVYVGDAAQTQIGGSFRYNYNKDLYVQARVTYFGRHYSNFEPSDLVVKTNNDGTIQDNRGRQSWLTPSYTLVDLSAGYTFKLSGKIKASIVGNVLNLFDTLYITDAQNNDQYGQLPDRNFDARSATVFMGMGRRYVLAMRVFF